MKFMKNDSEKLDLESIVYDLKEYNKAHKNINKNSFEAVMAQDLFKEVNRLKENIQ